jgi:transcriptional regulator with XRE-family HTH domain
MQRKDAPVPRLDLHPLGRRVAALRAQHALTQEQLARRTNLSLRTITLLEAGTGGDMALSTLLALVEVFGVSLDSLVFGEEPRA